MRNLKLYEMILCSLFTALIAIGAFIKIPVSFMDYFTLQFLFVILAGILLGPKLGSISTLVYVIIGLLGVPIFASGGGLLYVFKPTFGYLVGFVFAAYVAGKIVTEIRGNKLGKYLFASFSAMLVTYLFGFIYKYLVLKYYLGDPQSLKVIVLASLTIDVTGDIILCVMASIIGHRLKKHLSIGK